MKNLVLIISLLGLINLACAQAPYRYTCSSYSKSCYIDYPGVYPDLATCQANCGQTPATKYACDAGQCAESSSGTYDSMTDCEEACSTQKYSCTDDACVEDDSGTYYSKSSCQQHCGASASKVVGMYYADWARYRKAPYTYDASNLSPIVESITHLYYGFSFFCPPTDQPQPYWYSTDCNGKQPFTVVTIDPKDDDNIKTMIGYKSKNANLHVIASIGGWTFPSSFFSAAMKEANRATFIASIKAFTSKYGFDGVNFDWEYPCSQPRHDTVKISCSDMKTVVDQGGACSSGNFEHGFCTDTCEDGDNLVSFLTELRSACPDLIVSMACTANPNGLKIMPIKEMDAVLDHWQLMNYDFFVSDITSQSVTAPNQNLYTVESLGVENWSASSALDAILAAGATASKVLFGVAYYGHHYYVPGITDDSWQKFNIPATIQGDCCGDFAQTYGGKPGKGSQQCGTLMFSEIRAAGFETYYDNSTVSMIGYLKEESADGYTPAGTWINYLDVNCVQKQVEYAMSKGVGGAFAWDSTMDTNDNGQWTYELTKQMSDTVFNG